MITYEIIASIPASLFEWMLTNMPPIGILFFLGWLGYKALSWHNSKFSHIDLQFAKSESSIEVVNTRLGIIEDDIGTLKKGQQHLEIEVIRLDAKIDSKFDALDAKIDSVDLKFTQKFEALNEKLDEKFDAIDKRFDAMDKRFEKMDARFEKVDARFEKVDAKFEAQNEIILRMLASIEGNQRNLSLNR